MVQSLTAVVRTVVVRTAVDVLVCWRSFALDVLLAAVEHLVTVHLLATEHHLATIRLAVDAKACSLNCELAALPVVRVVQVLRIAAVHQSQLAAQLQNHAALQLQSRAAHQHLAANLAK